MVVKTTKEKRDGRMHVFITWALITILIVVAVIIGYFLYKNSHKGGYKCTEGSCVFSNDTTQSKEECKTNCTTLPQQAARIEPQEPEPRFLCSMREGRRVWIQVDPYSKDHPHAWTGSQITSHSNTGYCHPNNQNNYGVCPDVECNTDNVYVLPWGYNACLLYTSPSPRD